MSIDPSSTERENSLAFWRARFGFQVLASVTMVLLLLVVLGGLGKFLRSSLADHYVRETQGSGSADERFYLPGEEPVAVEETTTDQAIGIYRSFNDFIYHNGDLVDGFHKWAGYLMLALMPMCGILLVLSAKRLKVIRPNATLRPIGIAVVTLGLLASILAVASGRLAGEAKAEEITSANESVVTFGRDADAERALEFHIRESSMASGFAILFIIAGSIVLSTKGVKSAAGIGKPRKGS